MIEYLAKIKGYNGEYLYIDLFEIKDMCDQVVERVIKDNPKYMEKYEEYKKKVTRFSSSLEFYIHELGLVIEHPIISDQGIVFDEDNLPIMTDEQLGYTMDIDTDEIDEGIIDEEGYISFKNLHSPEFASTIILMQKLINDPDLCVKYWTAKKNDESISNYDFLVGLPNVIGIKKVDDKFQLNFAEANDENVSGFIDYLKDNGLLMNNAIVEEPDLDIMVSENDETPSNEVPNLL